ncbi:hypothetical protein FRC03_003826 [Tulasnella sp. 419]|nr:hypothetical protein FRC03_003826 [Tulasnella sp. 419]
MVNNKPQSTSQPFPSSSHSLVFSFLSHVLFSVFLSASLFSFQSPTRISLISSIILTLPLSVIHYCARGYTDLLQLFYWILVVSDVMRRTQTLFDWRFRVTHLQVMHDSSHGTGEQYGGSG